MGTSQWAYGSTDGSSWFYYLKSNNDPTTPADIIAGGFVDESAMYGVGEYLWYSGYDYDVLYNQRPYGFNGISNGFTAAQYRAEIDSGRPTLINITGHTMFGYGYTYDSIEQQTTVYVHDTWDEGDHTFTYGGYYAGSLHRGVMPLTIADGDPCGPEWDRCYYDTNYPGAELLVNVEGDKIRGQAIASSPSFPAPITGTFAGNKSIFAINYLGLGMRFYEVNTATGAGTTWGILDDGSYYDRRHSAQIYSCAAQADESGSATGAFDETFVGMTDEGDIRDEAGWDRCYYASDYPAEDLEIANADLAQGIIRGQCTYYPAPLTGYIYAGRSLFAIGYLNDNFRFYNVNTNSGAGTGWAIRGTDSSYYSNPHSVQIYGCSVLADEPGVGGTGDGATE
jgi:hypothetical protein